MTRVNQWPHNGFRLVESHTFYYFFSFSITTSTPPLLPKHWSIWGLFPFSSRSSTSHSNNKLKVNKVHPKLLHLMDDCRSLLYTSPYLQINHAFREANRCDNTLASLGRSHSPKFVLFFAPPNSNRFWFHEAGAGCT